MLFCVHLQVGHLAGRRSGKLAAVEETGERAKPLAVGDTRQSGVTRGSNKDSFVVMP